MRVLEHLTEQLRTSHNFSTLHEPGLVLAVRKQNNYLELPGVKTIIQLPWDLSVDFIEIGVFQDYPLWWNDDDGVYSEVIVLKMVRKGVYLSDLKGKYFDIYFESINSKEHKFLGEIYQPEIFQVLRVDISIGGRLRFDFKFVDNGYFVYVSNGFPVWRTVRDNCLEVNSHGLELSIDAQDFVFIAVVRKVGTNLTYAFYVECLSCVTLDGWAWTKRFCEIGEKTKRNWTHCRCTHLSVFAGRVFVPPNRIAVFSELPVILHLERGFLVLTVIGCIWVVWIVLLVWAARCDAVLSGRGVFRFSDTVPGDGNFYLVRVVTGIWRDAGTSANVVIQFFGTDSCSRRHLLKMEGSLLQGGEDLFVLATPKPLGAVLAVRVFHDSFGRDPQWYCEFITIKDLDGRKEFAFSVRRWLSLVKGDGSVDRVFRESGRNPLGLRARVVQMRHGLREDHLWLSVFTRSPESTFTSKERVTVAVGMLLLSLLANAMFYGLDEQLDSNNSVAFRITDLIIIIESLIVTVPAGVVITLLFKRSRPI